jgi:hypothetical protein
MAISKVITTVVDVGQGQCTFARLYDDSSPSKLVHTLLFDCGTDKSSPTTGGNITWIADTLKTMDTPTIDLLVFSHSDNDHISLMYDLLEAYGSKPKLKILSTWYAGNPDFYTKDTFNILDYLGNFCQSFTEPDKGETQYNKKKSDWKKGLIWRSDDDTVRVGMVMGNVIDDEPGVFVKTEFGSTGEKKNRVSIVCALMHDDRTLLICGDATNRTMAWVNDAFGDDVLTKCLMVTLPHHGSRATGLGVSSTKAANKNAIAVVETFVLTANARTASISAFAKHDHPSIELINYFVPTLTTTAVLKDTRLTDTSHFAVCNVDVTLVLPSFSVVTSDYHTLITKTNVLPTYYYSEPAKFSYQFSAGTVDDPPKFVAPKNKPTINPHACWTYVTTAGSGNSVIGYKQMPGSDTSKFTNTGSVPETVSAEMEGKGPFAPRSAQARPDREMFPPWHAPSWPTARPPPSLSPMAGGGALPSRLKVFR